MKTLLLVTAFSALPALAAGPSASGSYPPRYYRQPTTDSMGEHPTTQASPNADDNRTPRLDGNRTPGMFHEDRQ
jgi:hypothetical protein